MTIGEVLAPQTASYEASRFNALRHGVLSKYTVLPWEDKSDYETLLQSLVDEYHPKGPTEEHLVEELVGAIWRKRRLRIGERAAHGRALREATLPGQPTNQAALVLLAHDYRGRVPGEAVSSTEEQRIAALNILEDGKDRLLKALKLLETSTPKTEKKAYEEALAMLIEADQEMWSSQSATSFDFVALGSREKSYSRTAHGLEDFINIVMLPHYRDRRLELDNQNLIREQSFGEAVNTPALEGFSRYEIHLDRKFERTLAMLLKLQNLRKSVDE
jgi:hypothetical protein